MILIQSIAGDPHAQAVHDRLCARGASVSWFDPGDVPQRASIAVSCGPGRSRAILRVGGEALDLDDVSVVWRRRPSRPEPDPEIPDETLREYAARECRFVLDDLWSALDCAWVPGPIAVLTKAAHKFTQLRAAERLGFELPPTMITNDPDAVLEFRETHGSHLITKLPGPTLFFVPGEEINRYTQPLTRRDLGHIDAVRHVPVLVQPYIDKRVEIRATVVGDRVFAAEIQSQQNHRARADWRRYDLSQTPHTAHELHPDVAERCVRLVATLGLQYGAIDLICTPDDRYVFLEINPNGQYLWIEELTGLPISEALCDLLLVHESRRLG